MIKNVLSGVISSVISNVIGGGGEPPLRPEFYTFSAPYYSDTDGTGGTEQVPEQFDNVFFIGNSIMHEAGETLVDYGPILTESMGIVGTVDFFTAEGETSEAYIDRINEAIASSPVGSVLCIIHGPGNDVTFTRPFSSLSAPAEQAIFDNMTEALEAATAAGYEISYNGCTWRNYPDVPPESNGSLPYNENMFWPLSEAHGPNWFDSSAGRPIVDMFEYTRVAPSVFRDNLLHPRGHITAPYLLFSYINKQLGRSFDPSGKTFVIQSSKGPDATTAIVSGISTSINAAGAGLVVGADGLSVPIYFAIDQGTTGLLLGPEAPADTSYSLLNSELVRSLDFSNDQQERFAQIVLPKDCAGKTGKIRFLAAREAILPGDRSTIYTVQGVSLSHDHRGDFPVITEFDFTIDADGVVDWSYIEEMGGFSYFGAFAMEFDV